MAEIVEDTKNSTRNLPIQKILRDLLQKAAEAAGIDTVRVTSGGQPPYPGTPRLGSTRHDNGWAADLQLIRQGKTLSFDDKSGGPHVETFVSAAAALGATGIGAGVAYMGKRTIHVGFGTSPSDTTRIVWGADGKSAAAPAWLRAAAQKGWNDPAAAALPATMTVPTASGTHIVVARDGLRLRGGPGIEYGVAQTLKEGTVLTVIDRHGPGDAWARVDLENDGLVDGFVYAAFLAPAGDSEHEGTSTG
jgi:hypothetical protein